LGAAQKPGELATAITAESLKSVYADYLPMIEVTQDGDPSGGVHEDARQLLRPNWFADMLGMSGDVDDTLRRATL
ncbi:MAG: amidohydrolase, partial [Congregibacter sp.]|nr:amidohydrolase [Congregibacter sp.]